MNISLSIKYRADGKIFTADSSKTEHFDFNIKNEKQQLYVSILWSYPDFGRPLLKYADGKYPEGRFYYKMTDAFIISDDIATKVLVNLKCDKTACDLAGAPRTIQVLYTIDAQGVSFDVLWLDKDANRTTEAIFLHLYPAFDDFSLTKLGSSIDYKSVVSMGGRNLHAVEKCTFKCSGEEFEIQNLHSPLISLGQGKILEYDNKIEDCATDGISYVLYNNVWGTNFPLWYEDNACFSFKIEQQR